MLVPGCLCPHYLEGEMKRSKMQKWRWRGDFFFLKSIYERPTKNTNPSTTSGINMKKSGWNCEESVLMGCLSWFVYYFIFLESNMGWWHIKKAAWNSHTENIPLSEHIWPVNISCSIRRANASYHYHGNNALAVSGLEDYYGLFLQHVLMTAARCCYGKSKYRSRAQWFVFLFCKGSTLILH